MARFPAFHSRHIPEVQLNFNTPMGKDVKRNALCDTLEADTLKRLRDNGVELIETRLAWWDIEPEPGRFDWSRIENDIAKIEAAGMRVGLLNWLQHPPEWFNRQDRGHARFRCLEHNVDSTILSLWDAKTLEVYERLLTAVAERLGDRLHMIYVMISGDYGEVSTITGVKHYKFSPAHGHWGFWCGDAYARQSFAQAMQVSYPSLDDINTVWKSRFSSWNDDLMPQMPFSDNTLQHRSDFVDWYTGSVTSFTDRVCSLYRRIFPDKQLTLPIGHPNEHACLGQIKSLAVKIAAKYDMTARWTGCGYLLSFPKSNVLSRRVASAAHFYGAHFGTEAALILEKENAANALYEGLANGASQIHDDPQNILRAEEVHAKLRPKLFVDPPATSVVVFYPLESEMLDMPGFNIDEFIDRCASFREYTDYNLCDAIMIQEGYLCGKTDFVFPVACHIPRSALEMLIAFVENGGRVWIAENAEIRILHSDTLIEDCIGRRQSIHAGFHHFKDWSHIAPSSAVFALDVTEPVYATVHKNCISRFYPKRADIEVCE